MSDFSQVSLGILAGGEGRRLGMVDKSACEFDGSSLLQRTLAAMPQPFAERLLSYNRAAGARHAGLRCVPDLRPGFPGPLAAFEALLQACRSEWLLTVPVDCRDLPDGLAEALLARATGQGAVVRDGDGLQPLLGLWRAQPLRAAVATAMARRELSVRSVLARLELAEWDISPCRIGNLNTPADFHAR